MTRKRAEMLNHSRLSSKCWGTPFGTTEWQQTCFYPNQSQGNPYNQKALANRDKQKFGVTQRRVFVRVREQGEMLVDGPSWSFFRPISWLLTSWFQHYKPFKIISGVEIWSHYHSRSILIHLFQCDNHPRPLGIIPYKKRRPLSYNSPIFQHSFHQIPSSYRLPRCRIICPEEVGSSSVPVVPGISARFVHCLPWTSVRIEWRSRSRAGWGIWWWSHRCRNRNNGIRGSRTSGRVSISLIAPTLCKILDNEKVGIESIAEAAEQSIEQFASQADDWDDCSV